MTLTDRTPHLMLVRSSAMGDVAMVAPVVKALRAAHPDLRITILTRPLFKPFFRSVERIEFFEADFKGRHKGLGGIVRLWRDVMALGVTHVADLHDVLRTKMLRNLLQMSGVKVAVIDKGREGKRELTRKFRKELVRQEHSVMRYRDTVVRAGFDCPEPEPFKNTKCPIPAEITGVAGQKRGIWIGVAPFAMHKGKIYPTNLIDELIGMLAASYERVLIFGGGPYEKEFAEYMEQRHRGVVSVIGRIRLDAELDLMSNLEAMVTMDSSSMHMASLVGTPAVSIWGATHPYAGFYGFGQDPSLAVQLDLPCRPCSIYGNKPCMYGDYHCLTRITPRMVMQRVEHAVASGTKRRRGRPPGVVRELAAKETAAKSDTTKKPDTGMIQGAAKKTKAIRAAVTVEAGPSVPAETAAPAVLAAKRRGRPRKDVPAVTTAEPKRRGRPSKNIAEPDPDTVPKRRGRPAKAKPAADSVNTET